MNNQEKLYIDIDEEITTVIDRLRHVLAPMVYIVVPQRALLLQSIVNLRLLSQEAKRENKRIVIMTKDEEGIVFASRSGIEVQPFVGNEEFEKPSVNDNYFPDSPQTNRFSNNYFSNQNQANPNFQIQANENYQDNYSNSQQVSNFSSQNYSQPVERFSYQQKSIGLEQTRRNSPTNFSSSHRENNQNLSSQNSNFRQQHVNPTINVNVRRDVNGISRGGMQRNNVVSPQYVNQNQNFSQSHPHFSNRNFSQSQQISQNYEENFSNQNPNFNGNELQNDAYLNHLSGSKLSVNFSRIQQNKLQQNSSPNGFYANKNSGGHQFVDENFYQFDQVDENKNFSNKGSQNFSNQNQAKSYAETFAQDLARENPYNKIIKNTKPSLNRITQNYSGNRQTFSNSNFENSNYLPKKDLSIITQDSNKNPDLKDEKNQSLKKKIDKKNHIKSESNFFSKFLIGFVILVVMVVGFIFVFPKTDLTVKIKEVNISEKVSLTAKKDQEKIDLERMIIPAREIKKEVVYARNFESTGKADVGSQKAQGMVILNNETDQDVPMIKTTRFISENGILFRLADNVTIPKAKIDGTKKVNGTVKALLVADKAGEEGNIKSPTFFVVTYKETDPDKYKKVYAKSDSEMAGGGAGGKGMLVVTQEDIDKAKDNMEKSLPAFVKTEMAELVKANEEVLSEKQINYKISSSNSKVAAGTAVKEFSYEIITEVTALVFSQKDVDELAKNVIKKKNSSIDFKNLDVKYNSMDYKEDSGTLQGEALVTLKYKPEFNVDQFKQDILGKDYSEIEELIKEKYPQIEGNIEPKVFPSFMPGKVSRFAKMTKILVD